MPSPRTLPKTAVIGAGISGLTTGKNLKDYGCPTTASRPRTASAATGRSATPTGTSAYRSLHIDTSKHRLSFKDFPMPTSYPDYPHHTEIKAYLDDYADAFGLRKNIQFENGIEHARRLPAAAGS